MCILHVGNEHDELRCYYYGMIVIGVVVIVVRIMRIMTMMMGLNAHSGVELIKILSL